MPRIAVIAGDGIGREVVPEALKVLRVVDQRWALELELDPWPHGADHYLATGEGLSDAEVEKLRTDYSAIFLGALGDPRIPGNEHARSILLGLRFKLDLYVNFRPVRLLDERLTPLKGKSEDDVDFTIFRENTEGIYVGIGGSFKRGTAEEVAIQEDVSTRRGVERIVRAAFEFARQRGLSRVTMCDKANAMEHVGGLWRRTFAELARGYPEIQAETAYVDMLAMDLVRRPERYQVIVTGNIFGDILSDLGAQLAGGLGLAASANFNPLGVSLFEPVHGSAPDLVGTGEANPFAAILAAALMLDHLGAADAAQAVEHAVRDAVRARETTRDLGGDLDTSTAAAGILRRLERD